MPNRLALAAGACALIFMLATPAFSEPPPAAAGAAAGAAGGEMDHSSLAKASQNPVAAMISVPFENNTYFDFGPEEKHANVLNIKPVIPMSVTSEWNLINRFVLPVIWAQDQNLPLRNPIQGGIHLGTTRLHPPPGPLGGWGLGDLTYEGFISPAKPGKVIWGIGPALQFPTNTGNFGADAWSAGPAAVVLTMPGRWVVGGLVQQLWSFAKSGDQDDVSSFLTQIFINYNFDKGWYVTTQPVITANWEADGGNVWTLPVGGGFGKILKIGKQPMKLQLAGYYNALRPEFGPKWNLQFTMTFLFPKK